MSALSNRQQHGWTSQKMVVPKRKTIGWPRSYTYQQKQKRGWWETIRQLLF